MNEQLEFLFVELKPFEDYACGFKPMPLGSEYEFFIYLKCRHCHARYDDQVYYVTKEAIREATKIGRRKEYIQEMSELAYRVLLPHVLSMDHTCMNKRQYYEQAARI